VASASVLSGTFLSEEGRGWKVCLVGWKYVKRWRTITTIPNWYSPNAGGSSEFKFKPSCQLTRDPVHKLIDLSAVKTLHVFNGGIGTEDLQYGETVLGHKFEH
jgi:hypothetical protein